jgi:hypothetical protein
MAVTAAAVTKNVCMSRHWKFELVAYGIRIQPSPWFMYLLPLKPDHSSLCQSAQKVFRTLSLLKNPITIKLCIGIGHMSNQQKAEFVNNNFGIQSFWRGHGKILSKSWFRPKGQVCPEFWFIQPVEFLTAITRKPLTVWICLMDHRKSERISYRDGIQDVWSFGQSETQKLSSVQPLFYLETRFSS